MDTGLSKISDPVILIFLPVYTPYSAMGFCVYRTLSGSVKIHWVFNYVYLII